MAKTVQLSDEAYRKLKMLKKKGESFSDVVNRVVDSLKDPKGVLDLSPPRQDLDWEMLDDQMRSVDREKCFAFSLGKTRNSRSRIRWHASSTRRSLPICRKEP